ncbi:MAG TPA: bacteriocin [Anaeromyxobacteraceae bacterium]|nr:bacteriocin [Anaeromyxobacteraceae bacterium]
MPKNELAPKADVADMPIDGELTEEELESIVGGCGHREHRGHLPGNRTVYDE